MELLAIKAVAQTTNGSIKWKSTKGIEYNYIGELLNGKPHGVGFATNKDGVERIFGYFKNGMQYGKAAVWSLGYRTIADYKDGFAYGPGAEAASGDFKVGEFNHGEFSGKLIVVSSNEIYVLENGEEFMNGRIIRIDESGSYITDGYLVNGKLNGPGANIDIKENKSFIGTWKDDELKEDYAENFTSFLRSSKLRVEDNENHIMVYSGLSSDRKINDTCFVYEKKLNQRSFGYFDNGMMRRGIFRRDEKFSMTGSWDENGKNDGYCVSFDQEKDLFIAGNYKNGKLYGQLVSFNDKEKDDIIYIGEATEDEMTGEAIFLKNKLIFAGKLNKGLLEGKGKIIYPDGRIINGEYSSGKLIMPIEILLPGGKKMNTKPKNLNIAINFLLKEWENNFSNIKSEEQSGNEQNEYNCLYYFPGGISRILTGRKDLNGKPHHEFSSEIKKDSDYALIKKEYDNLCKQLTACSITSLAPGKPLKLISKINKLPEAGTFENAASFFSLPAYPGKKTDPLIRVMVRSLYDGYELTVDIISKWK